MDLHRALQVRELGAGGKLSQLCDMLVQAFKQAGLTVPVSNNVPRYRLRLPNCRTAALAVLLAKLHVACCTLRSRSQHVQIRVVDHHHHHVTH
jgi:hypothetical protein